MGCKIYHRWHAESQSTVMVMSFSGGGEARREMMRFGYQRKFSKQIFIDADDSKFFKLLEARELLPPPHTHTTTTR